MKKICISLILISIIILTMISGCTAKSGEEAEYLRIHVRADSNSGEDQGIKYEVKEKLTEYLTPILATTDTKKNAEEIIVQNLDGMKNTVDSVLIEKGFSYRSEIVLKKEKFPLRVYEEYTLPEGEYDALIVNLGSGKGDNWWCVIYPPLCFTGERTGEKTQYASLICDIIKNFKSRVLKKGEI